ncbi:MAG: coiled-coil domain-containing protein [Lachnospiraceae bacterium]
MRGRKIIGLLLTVVTLIFIIACLMFYDANQTYKAEKGIEEAIKNYSASMDDEEIKVLTKEIYAAVEQKLERMDANNLTEKDLEELLETVIRELEIRTLEYRDRDITGEEINRIANEVIKKVIELNMVTSNEDHLAKLEEYRLKLDQMTNLQQDLRIRLIQTQEDIAALQNRISQLEKALEVRMEQLEHQTSDLQKNVLYYQYNKDSQTLSLLGKE